MTCWNGSNANKIKWTYKYDQFTHKRKLKFYDYNNSSTKKLIERPLTKISSNRRNKAANLHPHGEILKT